jgi:hypothetical protein
MAAQFLISTLDGDRCSGVQVFRCYPRDIAPCRVSIGDSAGPVADLTVLQRIGANFPRLHLSLFRLNIKHNCTQKQTPWPLVREQTIPTDRPPLVDEI